MKTEKELKKLAKDVYEGNVFIAVEKESLECAFGIMLALTTFPEDTVALFEDISKAGPRSINGYPTFFSCGYLNKYEWEIFINYFERYKELVKGWEE